jgi:hypothetical protein
MPAGDWVLWSDLGELLSGIIPLIIAGGAVAIRFLLERAKAQNRVRKPPPPPEPQRGTVDKVRDEIAEFLRQSQQQKERGRPASSRPTEAQAGAPTPKRKKRANKPAISSQRRVEEVVIEAEVVNPRREGVAEHVSRRMSDADFLRRSNQPSSVDQADEEMAEHVASSLDHRLGSLEGRLGTSSVAPSMGERWHELGSQSTLNAAALLSSDEGLRAAMLLQEILPRPEHRW